MTVVLAAPKTIISTVTRPTRPALPARHPRHRETTTDTGHRIGRGQLADVHVAEPPRRRADRPAEHLDRSEQRAAAPAGPRYRQDALDTCPLRETDPVSVDRYRLLSRLGSGGMADVYLAVAPTGGPVAVKVLRADAEATEACRREYRLASAMDPECTAPALGHGVSPAGAYLVTAYLPGYRCATTLAGEPIPARQLLRFGSALARALAAVHTRGVVHCDVKPSNLLVYGDDVRIIDFGIARYAGELGRGGIVECSRGWAAPEQLWTNSAAPAVDIFAWGCLLAQLASGVHPYASRSEQEWILRLQSAQPDLFGLPPGLDDLIRAALARDPRDRPSARELAAACRTRGDRQPEAMPQPWRGTSAGPWSSIHNTATPAATVQLAAVSRPR
jgi:serine/threonine protein kinase